MSGRELPPSSPFAGDDGAADPRLTRELDALGAGRGSLADVVAALAGARVLVPVLSDAGASVGIVGLLAPDGRTALPLFSSVATMAAWRPDARPVPSLVARAALSAVGEGWEVIVLDPGGPVTVHVPRPAVWALAQQVRWDPAVVAGVVVEPVRSAVTAAVTRVPEVARADVVPGRRAEVAVVLALAPGLDRAGLDDVLARVNAALAADQTVAERVDSLELRLTTQGS
jgi:hypothetical protein